MYVHTSTRAGGSRWVPRTRAVARAGAGSGRLSSDQTVNPGSIFLKRSQGMPRTCSISVTIMNGRLPGPPEKPAAKVSIEDSGSMVFTTLTLSQMGNALAIRSDRESLFKIGLLSNKLLLGSVLFTLVLQLAVIYAPFMQAVFKTEALSAFELGVSLIFSSIVFLSVEGFKAWRRRGQPRQQDPD